MSGVALKDIFAARRLETSAEPDINAETLADIDSELGRFLTSKQDCLQQKIKCLTCKKSNLDN